MKVAKLCLDLIYPPFCAVCGELLPIEWADKALCAGCQAKWQAARAVRCPDCGNRADACRCAEPELAKLGAECAHLVPYRSQSDAVGRLLLTAKDENYHTLFDFFGAELADRLDHLTEPLPRDALITWLPRSRSNAAKAGVDQANRMAKALAAHRGCQAVPLLVRQKGGTQKSLTALERLDHARASYRLYPKRPPMMGRTVIAVDDILTTGASMLAAAGLLKLAGVERIICLTVAKTQSEKHTSVK